MFITDMMFLGKVVVVVVWQLD